MQAGIDCPMLTLEESLATQDWSAVLDKKSEVSGEGQA